MSSYQLKPSGVGAVKFGALGLGAVALGCAAFAAYLVSDALASHGYTGSRVAPVVVAARGLNAAQSFARDDVKVVNWPEDSVPEGAFSSIDALFGDGSKPPTPAVGIVAGEPVVMSRLSTQKVGTGVARLVRPNMRAVALKVDDAVGRTGLVYPGALVDVVVTLRDPKGRGVSSRIAVQSAKVLTVGMDTDVATRRMPKDSTSPLPVNQPGGPGTFVTLEVTPAEAEVLAIADNEGKLDLALRNGSDDQVVDTKGVTPVLLTIFGSEENGKDESVAAALLAAKRAQNARPARSQAARAERRRRIELDAKGSAEPAGKIDTHYAN
jgi:pilus assembly protein CpaB